MKITHSIESITPFGGFNFCYALYKRSGLAQLIDTVLGERVERTGFSYSQILACHLAVFLHGGDCTEDVNEHLRGYLRLVKDFNPYSADTILRAVRELSTDTDPEQSVKQVWHELNVNMRLNRLLVKALLLTGQLGDKGHTLDYDNLIIATRKHDARKTYKKCEGYQPGVATIGKTVVYVEGRNGNSQAKYRQEETLKRAFSILQENQVQVRSFRADSASYQQKVVEVAEKNCGSFYIRASRSAAMEQQVSQLPEQAWVEARLGVQQMEVAQLSYCPFSQEKAYRLVVSRIKRKDGQQGLFTGEYTYRAILTNDTIMDKVEVVSFYNARGASEKIFDVMNNDFGWSKLPCSFLSHNTAFLLMTALYANFYQYLITTLAGKVAWLGEEFRLKKFIFRFITVAGKWIKSGGQHILKLYTNKDYGPLLI